MYLVALLLRILSITVLLELSKQRFGKLEKVKKDIDGAS